VQNGSGRIILLSAGAIALAIGLAVAQGRHAHIGDDFAVFWQAGRSFAAGEPLYHGYPPGARQFKYPPFAALLLVPLGLLPLRAAATLFSFINLLLWAWAGYLTWQIVALLWPDAGRSRAPFLLSLAFSAQFFLDNFHHVQMNGVIFVLTLLGIHAYLRDQDRAASAYLVIATGIKVTPIFFLIWLVIRGRRRAILMLLPLAVAGIVVPLLARGPATGAGDLAEYYSSFLGPQREAEIDSYSAGQNLSALVARMTRPVVYVDHRTYRYLPASAETAQLVSRLGAALVLLLFLVKLLQLRFRRAEISPLEISLVFLAGLLLSPITFTTHLVSLLFVFYAFLAARFHRPWAGRPLMVLLAIVMGFIGLSGRDVSGAGVYHAVRGYSLIVWTMLLLFGLALILAGDNPVPEETADGAVVVRSKSPSGWA
jgi:Glycosyltransferase family 87